MATPPRITQDDVDDEIAYIEETTAAVMRILREQVPDDWNPDDIEIGTDRS